MNYSRLALLLFTCCVSAATGQTTAPKPHNTRYTVTWPDSTKNWNVGSGSATSAKISQTISDNLVRKLTARGFVRVRPLDVQCCTVQFELLNVVPDDKSHLALMARVTLLDIDRETIYTKEYRGEAASSRSALNGAAADLATRVLSDPDLMKFLAGS